MFVRLWFGVDTGSGWLGDVLVKCSGSQVAAGVVENRYRCWNFPDVSRSVRKIN
jgi:hypothetical protein